MAGWTGLEPATIGLENRSFSRDGDSQSAEAGRGDSVLVFTFVRLT